ncbi:MAG: DUF3575 domain-containing protein [Bacteroidia bacterium]
MISLQKYTAFLLLLMMTSGLAFGQISVGIEFQAYPTGFIPGLRAELPLGTHSEASFRLGYQIIDHQDFGVQDDETGSGFGGTLGYRYYLKEARSGFFGGLRSDLWFNQIDWETDGTTGQSNITVLQPTLEAGYRFWLGDNISIAPALGFGVEWNVATNGAETGQGAILLGGLSMVFGGK